MWRRFTAGNFLRTPVNRCLFFATARKGKQNFLMIQHAKIVIPEGWRYKLPRPFSLPFSIVTVRKWHNKVIEREAIHFRRCCMPGGRTKGENLMSEAITILASKKFDIKGKDANIVTVEIYYNRGYYNYFTSQVEPRGYYFGITPESSTPDGEMVSYRAFSGIKKLLFEVTRRSRKNDDKAVGMLADILKNDFPSFLHEAGYEIVG
jgi:hypothetical protein